MKLSREQLLSIYALALRNILKGNSDDKVNVVQAWIDAINEVLKGEDNV